MVTGGTRGIGRAVALDLAREGSTVIVAFSKDRAAAEQLCRESGRLPGKVHAVCADISQPDQVERLFVIADGYGTAPDFLINAAGFWPAASIWEIGEEDWRRTLAVNLDGTYRCSKAAAVRMVARHSGRIVNISSIAGTRGARSGHSDYAAAKGGVDAFTKSLASELGPYSITVNAVAPGMIRTELTREALAKRERDYVAQIPLGRIGEPEDVSGLVLFLLSPAASYITGQVIHVNGGLLMP